MEEKLYTKAELEIFTNNAIKRAIEMRLKNLTVGDICKNWSFDINCEIEVYRGVHDEGGELLYQGWSYNVPQTVAENKISYITTIPRGILIETL